MRTSRHYYAIPKEGSQTPPDLFEKVMASHELFCKPTRPTWMNFDFIDRCYEVDEQLYDPDLLRQTIEARLKTLKIPFHQRVFADETRNEYDFIVRATYGLGPSLGQFKIAKYQVAEKILIDLPARTPRHLPRRYRRPLHRLRSLRRLRPLPIRLRQTHQSLDHHRSRRANSATLRAANERPHLCALRRHPLRIHAQDAILAVPATKHARIVGSRFTMRVVENNPAEDRRTLLIQEQAPPNELHVFSGKVVSAVKAAHQIATRLDRA